MEIRREAIALLSPKGCAGAELGVAGGSLTKRFLDLGHFSEFHAVDKWDDAGHPKAQYDAVVEKLKDYEELTIWRTTAQQWLQTIPDGSLGFIYVDCYAHTGQDDGEILTLAWPKLAEGGLFSGDDYDRRNWPRTFQRVNEFANRVQRTINVYDNHVGHEHGGMDKHAGWYFYK